jgi:hypothetical protein
MTDLETKRANFENAARGALRHLDSLRLNPADLRGKTIESVNVDDNNILVLITTSGEYLRAEGYMEDYECPRIEYEEPLGWRNHHGILPDAMAARVIKARDEYTRVRNAEADMLAARTAINNCGVEVARKLLAEMENEL